MSFDFNQISAFKPKVENTFLGKGGGGGNTGYFQQERKKKEDEKSILATYLSDDKLEKMADENIEIIDQPDSMLTKLKSFIGKIV